MNGVHDLGGMHGFGPIAREADEPLFHTEWEAHVHTLGELIFDNRYFSVDAFRYGIERMDPAHYLRASYFERWLTSIESILIEEGLLTGDELDARTAFLRQHPDTAPPRRSGAESLRLARNEHADPSLPPSMPRFAVGDAVVARNIHPPGHTRLPRYARGSRGIIQRLHGPMTFPDTNAHGLGEHPQPLYNVRFDGRELWGDSAERGQTVSLDLWESYLEPALR